MIPLNSLLCLYLIAFFVTSAIDLVTEWLNYRHSQRYGKPIPSAVSGMIDKEALAKTYAYTMAKSRFAVFQAGVSKIVFLLFLLSGILPRLTEPLARLTDLPAGLVFFAAIGLAAGIFQLPFAWYQRFILEDRYGFNTQTAGSWLLDLAKSVIVTAVIGSILISSVLTLIATANESWWLWAWIFFSSFQLLMMIIFPTLIAPLFNKFTPIEDPLLQEKIKRLARDTNINVRGIFQMDASKRTRHTNAYFSGMGKAKRIVLYDSMINSHCHDEILAILAHEIGHLKKHHIKKQFSIITLTSLLFFYLTAILIGWDVTYSAFGFTLTRPYVGLFIAVILWGPVGYLLSPIGHWISRQFEREADRYSVKTLGTEKHLSAALKKLATDNLSNLHPHPFHVWLNYSHPPLPERIRYLNTDM